MTATISRPAPSRHSGGPASLAAKIGRALGCTPATAEQRLYGPTRMPEQVAEAVRVCVASGRTDVADRLVRPIIAALAQTQAKPVAAAAIEARQAEAAESVSDARFLLERSDAALAADLNEVERARRALDTYELSLLAEQKRRRA